MRGSNRIEVLPWWVRGIVVLGALLLAMGAIIAVLNPAMLASPHDPINPAVKVYAGYLFSRNLAIAGLLLAAMFMGSRRMLHGLVLLTACVQLLDAGMDALEGRWIIVPGVLLLGLVFAFAAARISGHAPWRVQAWREEGC